MEVAAKLLAELDQDGKTIDMRDLFIASVCLVNSVPLATRNVKHFQSVKGLEVMRPGRLV